MLDKRHQMCDYQDTMTDQNDTMLTVQDIARKTKHRDDTVRDWIKAGKLKAYAFGKGYRIDPCDFAAFKAARRGVGTHQ